MFMFLKMHKLLKIKNTLMCNHFVNQMDSWIIKNKVRICQYQDQVAKLSF